MARLNLNSYPIIRQVVEKGKTYEEVGEKLKVSRERVRQLIRKECKKLIRTNSAARKLLTKLAEKPMPTFFTSLPPKTKRLIALICSCNHIPTSPPFRVKSQKNDLTVWCHSREKEKRLLKNVISRLYLPISKGEIDEIFGNESLSAYSAIRRLLPVWKDGRLVWLKKIGVEECVRLYLKKKPPEKEILETILPTARKYIKKKKTARGLPRLSFIIHVAKDVKSKIKEMSDKEGIVMSHLLYERLERFFGKEDWRKNLRKVIKNAPKRRKESKERTTVYINISPKTAEKLNKACKKLGIKPTTCLRILIEETAKQ